MKFHNGDIFLQASNNNDWCHLCGTREKFFIHFQSDHCDYTRICESCVRDFINEINKTIMRVKEEEEEEVLELEKRLPKKRGKRKRKNEM